MERGRFSCGVEVRRRGRKGKSVSSTPEPLFARGREDASLLELVLS